MLRRLRVETRAHQCVADADALALVATRPTREAYRDFLVKLYGFEAPLEQLLAIVPELHEWLDLRAHRKSGLLAADLVELEVAHERVSALPRCEIAPFTSACEALGWVYVLERNVTTQQLLHRYLARAAPHLVFAGSYLSAHDRRGTDPWRRLGDAMEHFPSRTPEAELQLVAATRWAYDSLHLWLRPHAPSGSVMLATRHGNAA